jgi:uncharacterized protein (DUF1800 family)
MSRIDVFVALNRFGLGPSPGESANIKNDPRGWVSGQIARQPLPSSLAKFSSGSELYARAEAPLVAERQARDNNAPRKIRADALPLKGEERRAIYIEEVGARTRLALESKTSFVERLVHFWSNHFTVSVARPRIAPVVGAFEREAIRPYVFGRFHEMLRAVIQHPAMLAYLDNFQSVGPNSQVGRNAKRGLNENLARELLELHTLGVSGGYGQNDVEMLARVLTGWTVGNQREGTPGAFFFNPRLHEPGVKILLDGLIKEGGIEEGEAALALLARHPSTARFVCTKFARHFIADDPPAPVIEALVKSFKASDGDLMALTKTLIARPEAWEKPLAKVKTPHEYIVSLLRAAGIDNLPEDRKLLGAFTLLGQEPFGAPSPAGWPDKAEAWISPESLMRRLEWTREATKRLGRSLEAKVLAEEMIGAVANSATLKAVTEAGNPAEALFLLFASREFQRR